MALHKHWSAPAHADEPTPVEATPVAVAPAITHVWVATYKDGYDDATTRVFFTVSGCKDWKTQIARENWNTGDEEPEDDEDAAEQYFYHNDEQSFDYSYKRIS